MKIIKRYIWDILALTAIATVIGIFFFRFFWPEPQLLVTPDFGRSDAWHFSFATKFALSESLSRGQLPLWEPRMGMGFPLFAEGQVGALFLPNLLLMTLPSLTGLNPVTAYNATYVILFLTLGWGMYAWLRVIGCSRLASLFGGVTIMFSGQTIPRLPHHTLLQSLSMTPILLALAYRVLTGKSAIWISLFALGLSQQLFTGSPQPALLTLFMIGIYTVLTCYRQGLALSLKPVLRILLSILLAIGMSAIQLLPSAEMLSQSTSPQGFSPEEASYYSLPLVHLKTLVSPFILGNPKNGTYPPFTTFDGSIFWENNLYIGWLPFILAIFGIISLARQCLVASQGSALKNKYLPIFFLVTLIASFLLMLGKYSPVYLVYSVWPLNLFRVPSRFAWIFLMTIVSASAWVITQMTGRTGRWNKLFSVIVSIVVGIHAYQLMGTWWDYHAIASARLWLAASPLMKKIQATKGPVRTIGVELVHNKQFLKTGWTPNADTYRFLTNVPSPNGNIYWNITQSDVYAGRFLKRSSLVESLLGSELKSSETVATISATAKRLLDLYHGNILVSTIPLDIKNPLSTLDATTSAGVTITAYRNAQALPRAYLATQTVFTPTLSKAADTLANQSFIPGVSVLIHDQSLVLNSGNDEEGGTVNITQDTPTRVMMTANVSAPQAILVFGDTSYPGWRASINGMQTPIYPVNIKERGILLTKGNHEIIWTYEPLAFIFGARISLVTLILTIALPMVFPLFAARLRTSA
ncbi:MAG: hypothetical protein Q8L37_05865 [Candidatus Gottesmanbacteria bacterium]|nr:hypothetical protein [Candidatus Gottesmanbacteria bacterium]